MYPNLLMFLFVSLTYAVENNSITEIPQVPTTFVPPATTPTVLSTTLSTSETPVTVSINSTTEAIPIGCTCGVFLSGQFKKACKEPPKGNPALLNEFTENYACNNVGNKLCINKCLDVIVKHLPNSPSILCGSIDRDCFKERAYLFVKNCKDEWINSNLSAGREYCCKDGRPYKCPFTS